MRNILCFILGKYFVCWLLLTNGDPIIGILFLIRRFRADLLLLSALIYILQFVLFSFFKNRLLVELLPLLIYLESFLILRGKMVCVLLSIF